MFGKKQEIDSYIALCQQYRNGESNVPGGKITYTSILDEAQKHYDAEALNKTWKPMKGLKETPSEPDVPGPNTASKNQKEEFIAAMPTAVSRALNKNNGGGKNNGNTKGSGGGKEESGNSGGGKQQRKRARVKVRVMEITLIVTLATLGKRNIVTGVVTGTVRAKLAMLTVLSRIKTGTRYHHSRDTPRLACATASKTRRNVRPCIVPSANLGGTRTWGVTMPVTMTSGRNK